MQYHPYKYQSCATDFIIKHKICAIMLESGRGKKAITLTALEQLINNYFTVKKVLILTSKTAAKDRWVSELNKWSHLKSLKYSLVLDSEKAKLSALQKPANLYITNQESLVWLDQNNRLDFDTLIIDGLHNFKNERTKKYQILIKNHSKFKRIIALTTTPTINTLQFMWSQMYILDNGSRLGKTKPGFYERYFFNRKTSYSKKIYKEPKNGANEAILKSISDICWISHPNSFYDVPTCIFRNIYTKLKPTELSKYQWIEKKLTHYSNDTSLSKTCIPFSNTIKLMQLANGTIYNDGNQRYTLHEHKLDVLAELINENEGKNLLIAYWFPQDKWVIKKHFPKAKFIETTEDIIDWNNKQIPIGLINPATFNNTISLCNGGNTLIWYSLTWSEELYQKLNSSLYDITKHNNLVIIHILAKNTIDETIIETLSQQIPVNYRQIYKTKEDYFDTNI